MCNSSGKLYFFKEISDYSIIKQIRSEKIYQFQNSFIQLQSSWTYTFCRRQ